MTTLLHPHLWAPARPFSHRARWRHQLALFMSNLKHGSSGNLLRGPTGNLVHGCGTPGCACADTTACHFCPDATPTQFHVTFTDVLLCADCVSCPAAGASIQMSGDSILDGTYLLSHNGACAWTIAAESVPCAANFYASTDCSGTPTAIDFAIQQVRINATQFRLQVTDDTNTFLLFDAIVNAAKCCAGYTVNNGLSACGCVTGDSTTFNLSTGGSATVTPC